MFFIHPHTLFTIFICCLFCNFSYGQEISDEDYKKHKKALTLEKLDLQKALEKYKENIVIFKAKSANSPQYRELTARSYLNAGNCLRKLELMNDASEKFDEAINRYNKVIARDLDNFSIKNKKKIHGRLGHVYYNYSRVVLEQGDIKRAKDFNEQALQMYEQADYCKAKALNHNAIILYLELDYKTGTSYGKKALKVFDDCGNLPFNVKADILHTIAVGHIGLQEYDTAIDKYSKVLKYTENSLDSAKTLLNIAFIYIEKKDLKRAKKLLNQSLEIRKRIANQAKFDYWYSSVYENLGDIAMQKDDYESAVSLYNKAINNLKDDPTNETPYIYNKPDLLRVLDLKAQAAIKSDNIDLAYNTYQDLDNWTTEFYKDLSTDESKLTWIDRAHAIYGNAIETALLKGDQEKAFQYAEKAHAVLLWQSLSQQAARSLLSDKEREKMDSITEQIRQADQQYRNGKIPIDEIRTLEQEREDLEEIFDDKHPKYAQRKYQSDTITVGSIKSKIIDNQTAFVEYYLTNEKLYIFTITKDGLEVTQNNAEELADNISDFVKNISHENADTEGYHALAHKLYQQLIPQSIQSNDKISRLVITPDSEIGKLPFSALTTQPTSGKFNEKTPFLLKKYTTNYLYSAGSYLQLQQKEADQRWCFAGIAPGEYEMEKWKDKPLNQAIKELESIKSLHWAWNREILTEEEATKGAFENIISKGYRTILVSTHAVYGEDGGEIVFRDSILTQDAIDLLEINTHRLILSACETGVGEQNQGEGILSLGWNFAYKGVPSITMTHWKVKQFATKEIIVSYSEKLNDGMFADQALREAQLEYLDGIDLLSECSPYYWAAFFHTGNTM